MYSKWTLFCRSGAGVGYNAVPIGALHLDFEYFLDARESEDVKVADCAGYGALSDYHDTCKVL